MALASSSQRRSYYKPASQRNDNYERDRLYAISSPKSASVAAGGRVQPSKWYKEPRIPIHMNMSTMIRMKSKESKSAESERDSNWTSVSTLYADDTRKLSVFSPQRCNRRMFDYMQQKFETVRDEKFFGSSYTKNLFWGMVAEHDERRYNLSANPCGDGGFPGNGSYQRVAAINVQAASGCNVQYIEKISIHSKAKTNDSRGQQIRGNADVGCADTFKNLSISRAADEGCGESGGRGGRDYRGGRKKSRKSSRKPVVVTCLKNTSIKYVRK